MICFNVASIDELQNVTKEESRDDFMEEKTNGKAVFSFLLGALSMVTPYIGIIIGLVGLVASFLALREIKHNRKNEGVYQKGESIAVIAIILSIFGIL